MQQAGKIIVISNSIMLLVLFQTELIPIVMEPYMLNKKVWDGLLDSEAGGLLYIDVRIDEESIFERKSDGLASFQNQQVHLDDRNLKSCCLHMMLFPQNLSIHIILRGIYSVSSIFSKCLTNFSFVFLGGSRVALESYYSV
jgi:hypothetical protein